MTALPDAFTKKVHKATDCDVWIGATNNTGYGLISIDGRLRLAHRVAFEAEFGPIGDGLVLDHLCRVRNCVNPVHLQPVTQAENARRGRRARGLQVNDVCNNGHLLASEDDIYVRASGTTECRFCRQSGDRRHAGASTRRRTTNRRNVDKLTASLTAVNAIGGAA